MVIDHLGFLVFPDVIALRIIGRLAWPLFAWALVIGALHTRALSRYIVRVSLWGAVLAGFYAAFMQAFYLNILLALALSLTLMALWQRLRKTYNLRNVLMFGGAVILTSVLCRYVETDYGFWGIMTPVMAYMVCLEKDLTYPLDRHPAFWMFALGLCVTAFVKGWVQPFSLLALVFIAMTDGSKGDKVPSLFFYIFYPAQFVLVYAAGLLLGRL